MSYKIYPVTETELTCNDYKIRINGKEVYADSARVSTVPFNRRWPGHQRSTDQTELINFLNLETDEALEFEIQPKYPFDKVEIRPSSLKIVPKITKDGIIKFLLPKAAYFTVEPYGRKNALHIFADSPSNYSSIDKDNPDVIYFGKGEHDVGMINLTSNQTLFIDEGAVVYACVCATDAENIQIVGRGILDNSKNKEKILFECIETNNVVAVNNCERIHTIQTEYCKNIVIEGITIRDSLVYNIRPIACENLDIKNVKIIGCWRYNSDGIDMHNCVNVRINNCFIRTFDDSICVKGFDCYYDGDIAAAVRKAMYRNGKSYDVFKNAVIENCVIWNDWGKALEIGAETKAEEIYNIEFRNCNVIHSTGTVLDCFNVDWAHVHAISYRNITVEYDDVAQKPLIQTSDSHVYENSDINYCPCLISAVLMRHFEYSKGSDKLGKINNIIFENIYVTSKHIQSICIKGEDSNHVVSELLIRNIFLNEKKLLKEDFNIDINDYCDNIIIE